MGKKSHAPLFTLFVYFTHPYCYVLNYFFALPFKPIQLPCQLAQFVPLPFQPKKAPPDGDNCVKETKVEAAVHNYVKLNLCYLINMKRPSCATSHNITTLLIRFYNSFPLKGNLRASDEAAMMRHKSKQIMMS